MNSNSDSKISFEPVGWVAKNKVGVKLHWVSLSNAPFVPGADNMTCVGVSKEMLIDYAVRRTQKCHQYVAENLKLAAEVSHLTQEVRKLTASLANLSLGSTREFIDLADMSVEYSLDTKAKDVLVDRLVKFYSKHEVFSGESLYQRDGPIIEAHGLLADIADEIFKFKVTYK